jgi:hypothetical protein
MPSLESLLVVAVASVGPVNGDVGDSERGCSSAEVGPEGAAACICAVL